MATVTDSVETWLNSTYLNLNSTSPVSTTSPSIPWPRDFVHAKQLRAVYLWVLVAVGLPANTACVFTILSMAMSPYYVALLALADSLALILKLVYHQLISYRALTPAACSLMPLTSLLSCYANWVLALICLERFVAVCLPFKKQELFSRKRVGLSIAGLTLAFVVVFSPAFFFYTGVSPSGKGCNMRESLVPYSAHVWNAGLLSSLYFFLPLIFVIIFTTLIIRRLQVLRRRRQNSQTSRGSGQRAPEHAVSVMLVSAGLIFVVLMLPACLYHLALKDLFDPTVPDQVAQGYLLYQVVTFLSDTTHAINFFVYFLSAGKFRTAFVDLFRRLCPCSSWFSRKPGGGASFRTIPMTAMTDNHRAKDHADCETATYR